MKKKVPFINPELFLYENYEPHWWGAWWSAFDLSYDQTIEDTESFMSAISKFIIVAVMLQD